MVLQQEPSEMGGGRLDWGLGDAEVLLGLHGHGWTKKKVVGGRRHEVDE